MILAIARMENDFFGVGNEKFLVSTPSLRIEWSLASLKTKRKMPIWFHFTEFNFWGYKSIFHFSKFNWISHPISLGSPPFLPPKPNLKKTPKRKTTLDISKGLCMKRKSYEKVAERKAFRCSPRSSWIGKGWEADSNERGGWKSFMQSPLFW